jgi:predicted NBD/HSP70 family sugar kinase
MRQPPSATDCLVFDVGGTTLRAALYEAGSTSVDRIVTASTPNVVRMAAATMEEIRDRLLDEMWRLGKEILWGQMPEIVSVAFPGPIDGRGRVLAAPTIWGASPGQPLDLISHLASSWPEARIFVMNDVSAAGYRYLRDPSEDFCIVTVSSGIGHKVFIRGQPMVGPGGRGGEMGHVQVDFSPDTPLCDCGGRGHLGAVASGRGTLAMARRFAQRCPEAFLHSRLGRRFTGQLDVMENPDLVDAFHAGDAWTLELIRQAVRPLGQMLAAIHLGIGIERFVLIGGFALALGEPYRREVARAAASCAWDMGQDWQTMLELGVPDDYSGLIGAGRFALEWHRSVGI